jgi:hypothetical protein
MTDTTRNADGHTFKELYDAVIKENQHSKVTETLRPALQDLIAASEVMQNNSGYYRKTSQQQISSTQWSAWCRQLKIAKLALEVTK